MSASITECKPHDPAAVGWYLAYTKPRNEQSASAQLARQGYATYLPLYKTLVRTGEGMAVRHGPMFPRYVFFRPGNTGQSIAPVRSTLGVSHVVRFGAAPAIVGDALVSALRAFETEREQASVSDLSALKAGRPRGRLRRAAQRAGGPGQRHGRQAHHGAARRARTPDAGQCARSPAPGAGGLRPTSRPLGPSQHPPDAAAPPVAPIRATFRPLPAPGVGQFLASV
jgi:transcriptional antiterminator RfaH